MNEIMDIEKEACKERLLSVMGKYIRYSIKYKINIMDERNDLGATNIQLVGLYNEYYYEYRSFNIKRAQDIITKAEQLLAYRGIFKNV